MQDAKLSLLYHLNSQKVHNDFVALQQHER